MGRMGCKGEQTTDLHLRVESSDNGNQRPTDSSDRCACMCPRGWKCHPGSGNRSLGIQRLAFCLRTSRGGTGRCDGQTQCRGCSGLKLSSPREHQHSGPLLRLRASSLTRALEQMKLLCCREGCLTATPQREGSLWCTHACTAQ